MDSETLRQAAVLGAEGSPVHIDGVPLLKIELRKLRHAAVLAFEGNFARAAEKLHISPSALSQSIASLEDTFGLVLFDRDRRGVRLSSVGQQFIGRIDKLLFDARGIARDLALAGGAVTGNVVFGIRPTPARIFLSRLVREMVQESPQLRLKIGTTINEALIEYLLHEGFEFVLRDAPMRTMDERLAGRTLARLPLEFFIANDHPLRGDAAPTMAALRAHTIACPNLTDDDYDDVAAMLGLEAKAEFPGAVWCDDYAYLLDAVQTCGAVLIAPRQAVAAELARGDVQPLKPVDMPYQAHCEIQLVTLANRALSPAVNTVIRKIEALLADQAGEPG